MQNSLQYIINYEVKLSDYLGNVSASVSDVKIQNSSGGVTLDFYSADILSSQDYYPGGFLMPGRSFSSNSYRFGYNADSEKDDEITGVTGAHFTTYFREFDTRILKPWALDPVFQPWQSPYIYMDGNPIWFNDPKGEIIDPTDEKTEQATNEYIKSFSKIEDGKEVISGDELFGIEKDEMGKLTSSLDLSVKKFTKRAEKKGGLSGDKLEDAINFYKLLQAEEVVILRSISEGETEASFYDKGKPIPLKSFEDYPEFNFVENPIVSAPNRYTNFASKRSIAAGFSKAMYNMTDKWAMPHGTYETYEAMIIFKVIDDKIVFNSMQSAFKMASDKVISDLKYTREEIKRIKGER